MSMMDYIKVDVLFSRYLLSSPTQKRVVPTDPGRLQRLVVNNVRDSLRIVWLCCGIHRYNKDEACVRFIILWILLGFRDGFQGFFNSTPWKVIQSSCQCPSSPTTTPDLSNERLILHPGPARPSCVELALWKGKPMDWFMVTHIYFIKHLLKETFKFHSLRKTHEFELDGYVVFYV